MFGLGTTEILIFVVVAFLLYLLLYAVVHCIGNKSLSASLKVVWLLAIIFLNPVGAIVYFVVENIRRNA